MKREILMFTIILAVVAAVTLTLSSNNKNSLTQLREKAIVTQTGKFSPLVRLNSIYGRTICSGTVITQNLVLTAAHCLGAGPIVVESLPNENADVVFVYPEVSGTNVRADYALLNGDFSQFSHMDVETNPEKDLLYNQTDLAACGFPYGAGPVCYPIMTKVKKMFEGFVAEGQMYPAMSGGPVIDLKTNKVIAVNKAIGDNFVMFSPLIGLFEMSQGR